MIARNVFRRRGRTIMSITAVAISMVMLVSMLSVAEGMWQVAQEDISKSREDILVTAGAFLGSGSMQYGHALADKLKADNPNITEAAPFDGGFLLAALPDSNISGTVMAIGLIPERSKYFLSSERTLVVDQMSIKFRSWFDVPGDPHYADNFSGGWTNEVFVDAILADNFGLVEGSNLYLSAGFGLNVSFHVSGLFETQFSGEGLYSKFFKGSVILHLSEYQSLKHKDVLISNNRTLISDTIGGITIALDKSRRDPDSAAKIAMDLKKQYPQYTFWTKQDMLEWYSDNIVTARIYYTAISSVSITIGLLFVTCIMIMSVNERRNEIGMMRAIGISRRTIFINILLESVFIVGLGALIGMIPGYFGSAWLGQYISDIYGYNRTLTAFTLQMVLSAYSQLLITGAIISLYPAWKASRMNIQSVIRSVG